MTEREALKLALEALEKVTKQMLALKDELAERGARPTTDVYHQELWDSAFEAYTDHALPAAAAIKEALAQTEQRPVANYCKECLTYNGHQEVCSHYTIPPQRTWVGLTDEEVLQCQQGNIYHFYRRIEAKLKEKNDA